MHCAMPAFRFKNSARPLRLRKLANVGSLSSKMQKCSHLEIKSLKVQDYEAGVAAGPRVQNLPKYRHLEVKCRPRFKCDQQKNCGNRQH
eukprot:1189288-Amphidinium_carterae.1